MTPARLAVAAAVLVAAVLAVQLVPVARDNPPVTAPFAAPPDIEPLLRRACYDCHSHATVWPWYSRVAPVSWLVAHDVTEGRDELNFSTFAAYPPARRQKKLRESAEQLREGEMPPWYYTVVHPEARLTDADRDRLVRWFTGDR